MTSRDAYETLATAFVEEQQDVLGRQAVQLASSVDGLSVADDGAMEITADGKQVIDRLCDQFVGMLGVNIEDSVEQAAGKLDRPVELPASLLSDRELRGYIEYRATESWVATDEFAHPEPQPELRGQLVGVEPDEHDDEGAASPLAPYRGVPMDASEQVYEAWLDQKRTRSGIKTATGHTWLTATEIPGRLLSLAPDELVQPLRTTTDRFGADRTRLVVWLRCDIDV